MNDYIVCGKCGYQGPCQHYECDDDLGPIPCCHVCKSSSPDIYSLSHRNQKWLPAICIILFMLSCFFIFLYKYYGN